MVGFRHEADAKDYNAAYKGDEYEFDVTIDIRYYQQGYTGELLPAINAKTPWLISGDGTRKQDNASPHTGNGTEEELNRAGTEEG